MRANVLTKLSVTALAFYAGAIALYLFAREIYSEELERQLPARLFWGMGVVPAPNLNNWHYAALTCFCLAVAITFTGVSLKRAESRVFMNKILKLS